MNRRRSGHKRTLSSKPRNRMAYSSTSAMLATRLTLVSYIGLMSRFTNNTTKHTMTPKETCTPPTCQQSSRLKHAHAVE
eukprot:1187163-Prorocentrum_minimum.AAC.7